MKDFLTDLAMLGAIALFGLAVVMTSAGIADAILAWRAGQ